MLLIYVSLVFVIIIVYMIIPFSPIKIEYWKRINKLTQEYRLPKEKITEEDLKVLPKVIQKYFIKNGYIGIESVISVLFDFKKVKFSLGVNKPNIKINYTVHSFVKEPTRVALIDSKMFGIPFQGIDTCKDGKGSMKGVIGKHITLFNKSFDIIDLAYLSECLMHPSLALQKNITYKEIDDYSVEATISKNGIESKGVFHFNTNYEMTCFVVDQRLSAESNTFEKWSVETSDYKIINGINRPTRLKAIWHFQEGDLVYFDGCNMNVFYK